MPTLDWIGKRAVVNHHRELPYRLLHCDAALSAGEAGAGNLLVEGDNLHALKALLPYYAGRVKCIYIDPPYNTGNEGWVYNDNVKAPEIQKWLGDTVGKEAEDLSRHDKWLCMMYPRLALLKEFLADDGVMFVSIDDGELPSLRILLDEMFPDAQRRNRLACFVWQTDGNFDNQAKIKICHEYVLAYSRRFEHFPPPPVIDRSISEKSKLNRSEIRNTVVKNGPKNPISEIVLPVGFPADFEEGEIPARTDKWPRFDKNMRIVAGKLAEPITVRSGWSSKGILEEFIAEGFQPIPDSRGKVTVFVITQTGNIENIKKRSSTQSHVISVIRDVGSTQSMSEELKKMGVQFSYPKPIGLISYLISMVADKTAIVLDSFAGSGTTGNAVLALNKRDGGNRRFILVQMPYESETQKRERKSIARNITAERLRRVINGYGDTPGLGGGFRFCTLGEPMLDAEARFHPDVKWSDLGHHLWFAETGEPWNTAHAAKPGGQSLATGGPMLGVAPDGRAIYLLHTSLPRGPGDKVEGNALTPERLARLAPHAGPRVVYGEACTLRSSALSREQVVFKQIPYQVRQQ